jgi:outer membrane protein insertion porin family
MNSRLCLLILAVLSLPCLIIAQGAKQGLFEVKDVSVQASGGTVATDPAEYVLSRVFAKPGAFVSAADLARDQRSLLDTGTFSDVKVLSEEAGDGAVKLIYRVVIAPRFLAPAKVSGNDAFSERKIRRLLDLAGGDRIDQARLDERCDKIRDEYRKSYYYDVSIDATVSEPDEEGFSNVSLVIDEGQRARISGFDFHGNDNIPSSELNSALGKPAWYNPVPFFYFSWRQQALDFEHVRDTVTTYYRDRGYLDATVSEPVIIREDDDPPRLKVEIREGAKYAVDGVTVAGVSLFPEQELTDIAKRAVSRSGEKDVASAKSLSNATKAVREYYTSRGYADTTVRLRLAPAKEPSDDGLRHVRADFEVKESGLSYVRSVSIHGNTRTKDKVVRRELTVAPGLILNEVAAEQSKKRIENLGFFENVRFHETPSREDPLLRDLVYEVEEKNTGQLMVGVGTSSIDDILGYLELSQNNFDIGNWPTFRGGGQKAKLGIEMGSDSNSGEISWTDPWFLDRRQSLTINIYRREISYNEYDETRIGGGVSLTVPLHYGRGTVRLGAEHVAVEDVLHGSYTLYDDPDTAFAYTDMDDAYWRIPLRLSWLYDTRNRYFTPTSGSYNTVFSEITSSSFGSEYDTYKVGCDLRQYVPLWWNHYVSLRFRAESIDAYGDTEEVPVNDRLFLGGGRSVRGYRYRNVGPKAIPDEMTGGRAHPVGGQTLAMFSAEFSIPIISFFRIASFYDIGNVWKDPFDADLGEYASSWGFGVRFDIPSFPIRLDYAFPLVSDDHYTRHEHFIFWIGID